MTAASLSESALRWVMTYSLHSALLAVLGLLVARFFLSSGARLSTVLKVALFGALISASLPWKVVGPLEVLSRPLESSPVASAMLQQTSGSLAGPVELPTAAVTAAAGQVEVGSSAAPGVAVTSAPNWGTWFLAGLGAASLFLLAQMYLQRRRFLVSLGRSAIDDEAAQALLRDWSEKAGRTPILLTVSSALASPVALSATEICVPARCWQYLDLGDREALLAHEFAHIERLDPLWFTAAAVLERLFFFLPWHRALRKHFSASAEVACDALAARRVGSATAMARCLAAVATWGTPRGQAHPIPASVPSMAASPGELVTRVRSLLEGDERPTSRGFGFGAALALVGFACSAPSVTTERTSATETAITIEVQADGMARARGSSLYPELEAATFELDTRAGKDELHEWLARAAAELPLMTQDELAANGVVAPTSLKIRKGVLTIHTGRNVEHKYALKIMNLAGSIDVILPDIELLVEGERVAIPLPFDMGSLESGADSLGVQRFNVRLDREDSRGPETYQLDSDFGSTIIEEVEEESAHDDYFVGKEPLKQALDLEELRVLLVATQVPNKKYGATIEARRGVSSGAVTDVLHLLIDLGIENITFMGSFEQ